MQHPSCASLAGLAIVLSLLAEQAKASVLERFNEQAQLRNFSCRHLYLDSKGEVAGACLVHSSGFTLDLLPMDTAPQAFVWINTPVADDRGEPHTLEHLLLGKGRRGLSVANAEEFRLSSSSAFTGQLETCYHFSTALGTADFLVEFEDRLDALLHPDFSDEEIRREVCHVGPKQGPAGLELEEKGTVYTEMLSSWDNAWSQAAHRLQEALHGRRHPLAVDQGGIPEAIRRLVPQDIRDFHRRSHFLGNMGAQVVLPAGDMTEVLLQRLDQAFQRVEPTAPAWTPTPRGSLPPSQPSPNPLCEVLEVPGAREGEPALILAAWPPVPQLQRQEVLAAQFFLSVAAQGESSDLHRQLMDPALSQDPLGAAWISAWISGEPGNPVNLAIGSVPAGRITQTGLADVRQRVLERLGEVAGWPAGHAELDALKNRELALIQSSRRQARTLRDHPPGFGQRGTGSNWADHLRTLRQSGEFRLSLGEESALDAIEAQLRAAGNPYGELLARLGMLNTPHMVGTRSQPALVVEKEAQRVARLEAFADSLEQAYGTQDRQEALRRFAADYDRTSEELEAQRAGLPVPDLPAELPLDQDPEILVEVLHLGKSTPLCHGVFDAMQVAQFELMVDVNLGAGSPWLGLLPALLTETGLAGEDPLDFRQVEDALRRDVGWASCWLDVDLEMGRAELGLGAQGADASECARGLRWLQRFCTEADWSVANRPRLREVVRRELANARERRKGSEESWVDVPAAAWRQRQQHALLHAGSFLTQEHDFFRCAWALEERPQGFEALLDFLAQAPGVMAGQPDSTRAWLRELLEAPDAERAARWASALQVGQPLESSLVKCVELALTDLEAQCAEVPVELFTSIWQALVLEVRQAPLLLAELETLRPALLQGSRRAIFTGSRAALQAVQEEAIRLDGLFAQKSRLGGNGQCVDLRLPPAPGSPLCGLVDPAASSGVVIAQAPLAWQHQWTPTQQVDYLAGNLLGGGSDQGLFMQTWAAGLAYSNGIRPRERTGTLRYYAERCPDVAQTLSFVEERVRQAPPVDEARARTAFVTALGGSRGAQDYTQRSSQRALELQLVAVESPQGRRMQAWRSGPTSVEDLQDFRRGLAQRMQEPRLAGQLQERKLPVHSLVFPGLSTETWQPPAGGQFFIIGPERQFELVDGYLASRTNGLSVERLHPCHWWLMEGLQP